MQRSSSLITSCLDCDRAWRDAALAGEGGVLAQGRPDAGEGVVLALMKESSSSSGALVERTSDDSRFTMGGRRAACGLT